MLFFSRPFSHKLFYSAVILLTFFFIGLNGHSEDIVDVKTLIVCEKGQSLELILSTLNGKIGRASVTQDAINPFTGAKQKYSIQEPFTTTAPVVQELKSGHIIVCTTLNQQVYDK